MRRRCVDGGGAPQQSKYATIKVLHKKNDRTECGNYRAISLVDNVVKVHLKVIAGRLSYYYQRNILPDQQCGLRRQRPTADIMSVLHHLQALARKKDAPWYLCYVDVTKAYEPVD